MGEYLQVLIRQEGSRIDGGDFLKQDLRVVQEKGLVLGYIGIRQLVFWCFSEEGLTS